mmetsp:Transcript_65198/g.119997  ORF Transcript_65198/g.119997 Transcript_65198/m.119997 type:complete len:83 (+) Transcript_65198:2-250(+)
MFLVDVDELRTYINLEVPSAHASLHLLFFISSLSQLQRLDASVGHQCHSTDHHATKPEHCTSALVFHCISFFYFQLVTVAAS